MDSIVSTNEETVVVISTNEETVVVDNEVSSVVVVTADFGPQGIQGIQGIPGTPYASAAAQLATETARDAAQTAAIAANSAATSANTAATSAQVSANTAASKNDLAAAYAASALQSKNSANISEINATAAATTATNKATQVDTALNTALVYNTNMATAVTNAQNSAQTATTKATEASNNAALVATTYTNINALLGNFDATFLGSYATDPTKDKNNNTLKVGALYYNTVISDLKFYNGVTWETPNLSVAASAAASETSAAAANTSANAARESATNAAASSANALASANSIATTAASAVNLIETTKDTALGSIETAVETLTNISTVVSEYNTTVAYKTNQVISNAAQVASALSSVNTSKATIETGLGQLETSIITINANLATTTENKNNSAISATAAAGSATAAAASATSAANSVTTISNYASSADSAAGRAATSATSAASSASSAASAVTTANASANNAATSATAASSSATAASSSATAAAASAITAQRVIWRNGSGAPSNTLGVNDDFYLDTANGDVYRKTSGSYTIVFNIKGAAGPGITNIQRTSGTGLAGSLDTYTVTYANNSTATFTVQNGVNGTNGRSVSSISRTNGNGAAGSTDTYTITYSDATTSAYTVTNGAAPFAGYGKEIHVSQADGNDTTGTGSLLNPVATITKAMTLVSDQRRKVIVHSGGYTENFTIDLSYVTVTSEAQKGDDVVITGTVTANKGCTISGLKMTNLTITAATGTGSVNILGCDITGTLTKSGAPDYTLIRFCDIGTTNITGGGGLVAIFGGNPNSITINNAAAKVIVKNAVTVSPVLTAGNANFVDSIVIASGPTSNAITSAAGTIVTLANSQFIVPLFNNVAKVSLSGFYSIFNCVYDKPNSTLAVYVDANSSGGSTKSIDYFQYINADKLILATGGQITFPDGSIQTTAGGSSVTNLDSLTDVAITTPSAGQVLKYNGTDWTNGSSVDLASPGPIGSTTPAAGSFTTLSASTAIALNSGGTGKTTAPAAQTNLLGYTSTVGTGQVTFGYGSSSILPYYAEVLFNTQASIPFAVGTYVIVAGNNNSTGWNGLWLVSSAGTSYIRWLTPSGTLSMTGLTNGYVVAATFLTNTSSFYQTNTGTGAGFVLPDTSTLQTGWSFRINNASTTDPTYVCTSTGAIVASIPANSASYFTCVSVSDNTAAAWRAGLTEFNITGTTGSGNMVLSTSPTITSPVIKNGSIFNGATSGTITVIATAVAGTRTLTLPAATDTLVGKATTDTLTNKTLNAAILTGTLTANSSTGTSGQYLQSTATGVQWNTITVTNGTNGTNGRGITSIARTSGTGVAGTTDTYTITYSDASTSTYTVTNGANGTGGGGAGAGVATGGTQGQVLVKSSSTDYETAWSSLKTINGTSIAGTGDITITSGVTTGKAIAMAIVFG